MPQFQRKKPKDPYANYDGPRKVIFKMELTGQACFPFFFDIYYAEQLSTYCTTIQKLFLKEIYVDNSWSLQVCEW